MGITKNTRRIYPSNEKYLNNISKIRINLDNTLALKDIPFCYSYNNILNPDKNYSLEKYAIFSSKFQIYDH